jgi:hypothetical protein
MRFLYKSKNRKLFKWKIFIINILFYGYFNEIKYKVDSFPNYSICMCSIIKEENLYIKEFINHYRKLGYNHFFIYDNNDKNGERLQYVISEEIQAGLISIIDFRSFRGKRGGPQMDAYYNCYEKYNNYCSWISFFDIDEFLVLDSNNITLKQLLENSRYKNCEGISINWKIYHDNNLLKYQNISVMKRFTGIKENYKSNTSKLIARGKLSNKLTKSYSAHTLWYNIKLCNTLGKNITTKFWMTPFSYKYAYLNHYYTKTIAEYCNKIKKGNVYFNLSLNQNTLLGKFNNFFDINNKTELKVSIFNRFFNTSFKYLYI